MMVYTITGENDFLIDDKVKNIVQDLISKYSDIETEKIDSFRDVNDIKMNLINYSIFSNKRLLILDTPSSLKGFDEMIINSFDEFNESLFLILIERKLDKRSSYYKFLIKKTNLFDLNHIKGAGITRWLIDWVRSKDGQIEYSDADYLIKRIGNNQLILSHEIDKLLLFQKRITKNSIDLLTESSIQSTIFNLLSEAFNNNLEKALTIYNDQRNQGIEPEVIMSMITWQLKVIALIKSNSNNTRVFLEESKIQ